MSVLYYDKAYVSTEINHTMVLDGIEGFIPQPDR
jgi:hypothetical protein